MARAVGPTASVVIARSGVAKSSYPQMPRTGSCNAEKSLITTLALAPVAI